MSSLSPLLSSLQFFSIILIIFIAEVGAGVVALAYSSFVSSPLHPFLVLFIHCLITPPHTIPLSLPPLLLFTPFPLSLISSGPSQSFSVTLSPPRPTLWILSPCKFSIIATAIIELLALCPPHYIWLLNDSGIAQGRVRCLTLSNLLFWNIEAKAFYMQNSLFTYVSPSRTHAAHTHAQFPFSATYNNYKDFK